MTRREKINFNMGFKLRQVNSFLILLLIFIFLPSALMAAGKASVKNIRHQSFQGYTRVTIHLSGPVEFSKNRISKPERLFFDIKDATLSKKIKASFNVRDGILKSVRARQFSKDTVRVVFDLEKIEDFKASLINKKNPRLVIDIYGFKTAAKEPSVVPPAPIKKPDIITPPLTKEVITPPTKPEAPVRTKKEKSAGRASVKNIRHQSFQGYTRVTIHLSGPVEFSKNRISKPERLFFDIKDATLSKKIKASFNVRDGILKSVRARQFSKDTVRVVFDLEKIEDFKASLINKKNPRLVIDIYGFKTAAKEPSVVPPAPIKKPDIITPPLTKEPTVAPPATKEPEIIAPPLTKEPAVAPPTTTKESAVTIPAPIKPEAPVRTKEDAGNLIASGGKYIESGEYEKALLDFRKAAELSPGHSETSVFIGRSLFKLGKKEEAIAAYKQALEYDPDSADAYDGLGYAYYAQGKPSSAVDAFLTAIKLNPEHDDAHAGLGYTYLTIGDINSAIEHYRILRGLDSNKADELFHLIFKVQMKEQTKEQTKTLK